MNAYSLKGIIVSSIYYSKSKSKTHTQTYSGPLTVMFLFIIY